MSLVTLPAAWKNVRAGTSRGSSGCRSRRAVVVGRSVIGAPGMVRSAAVGSTGCGRLSEMRNPPAEPLTRVGSLSPPTPERSAGERTALPPPPPLHRLGHELERAVRLRHQPLQADAVRGGAPVVGVRELLYQFVEVGRLVVARPPAGEEVPQLGGGTGLAPEQEADVPQEVLV